VSENVVILCADGSELSTQALAAGLALIDGSAKVLVVTVVDSDDPSLVTGAGLAGPTVSPAEYDELSHRRIADGETVVRETARALGLDETATRVVDGPAGRALCDLAAEIAARAMVIGSRGRGGFKRALLGSVSDFVVRNAPCPVIVTSAAGKASTS
jgi:nucleotide-binding universal stress UspA family protein